MKSIVVVLFVFLFLFSHQIYSQSKSIELPEPDIKGGKPLMQALSERKTQRDFDAKKELSGQQLSNLLWAACGINRESGKRTAPTAVNWQEINIYVSMKSGVYLYNALNHELEFIHNRDVRTDMGKNKFTKDAPVCLAFVSDYSRMNPAETSKKDFYSATDTGFISQNIYLFCASEGLATVVLGYIDRDKIVEILELENHQKVVLTQCVGFPKSEFDFSN